MRHAKRDIFHHLDLLFLPALEVLRLCLAFCPLIFLKLSRNNLDNLKGADTLQLLDNDLIDEICKGFESIVPEEKQPCESNKAA